MLTIREVEVETYAEGAFCSCGEMLKDGEIKSHEPFLVEHTCEKCGKKYDLEGGYPKIKYRFK